MPLEPVELTPDEVDVLKSLARNLGQPVPTLELVEREGESFEDIARKIVREEIASLAGLALRRTQDRSYTRSGERNIAIDAANEEAAQLWGEVLAEYGKDG